MPSFPLLRLPKLALTEVLRCLDPIELFIFAQTSLKASSVVPLVKSKSFRIEIENEFGRKVTINKDYRFSLEKCHKYQLFDFKCSSINAHIKREREHMLTIHSDDDYEKFIWYFCNLFKSSIRNVEFLPVKDFDQITAVLFKIGLHKTSIEELEITGYKVSSDVMRNTLDAIQKTNLSLALSIKPFVPSGFVYNLGKLPERLKVEHSHWFTMANLMQASNCAHIDLHKTSLTIQDMKEFMNRWKQGKFPNLEYFQASKDSFDINDYPDFEDRQNMVLRHKRISNTCISRFMKNGVKVRGDNGQKAEYRLYGNWFQFFVLSEWDI